MKLLLFLPFIFIIGCSSSGLTEPPTSKEIASIKSQVGKTEDFVPSNESSAERQASAYIHGLHFLENGNLKHACSRFEYLSKDKTFPLSKLSWIISLKSCDYSLNVYQTIWDSDKNDIPSWLKKEYVETSLEIAKRLKVKKYIAHFTYESSRYKKIKKERIELVKEALEVSKKTKEPELFKKIRGKLHKLAPRLKRNYESGERFKIGRDYENVREFEKARRYYRKIIRDPREGISTKKMAWNRLRLSYKLQRQKPTYVHKTEKMVRFFKKKLMRSPKNGRIKKIWVDTSIKHSRALWTLHKRGEGRKVLLGLLKYGVNDPDSLAQIHWILGSMKVEEKKYKEAIEQYEIATELNSNNKSLNEKIIWALGWNYYLLGGYQKVIDHFSNYVEKSNSFHFNLKLKFWIAKSLKNIEMNNKAEDIFEKLIDLDPFGYYGIISHMELDKPLKPVDVDERDDYHEDLTIEWLIALQEKDLAQSYLKSIQGNFKTTEKIIALLPLYERAGWYEGGIFKFFKIKAEDRPEVLEDHATSAFPIPYQDLAKKAEDKFKVPADLIFSITRQESAFNPVIRSWADAFGLMQLTPERAKELATRYEINYESLEDLYDPETNIQLGAALLGELKEKFDDNFIQYVASYNASESVVAKWFKRNWDGDPLKFIEMIPYEETQGYVKLVFRNLISYRRLLSDKSFYINPEMFTNL